MQNKQNIKNYCFYRLVPIILLLVNVNAYGQNESFDVSQINTRLKLNLLYLGTEQLYYDKENKLFPIQGFLTAGVCRYNYNSLKFARIRHLESIGLMYHTTYNIIGARAGIGFSFCTVSIRCYLSYYNNFEDQQLSYKPVIGFDFKSFSIHWGPNIAIIEGLEEFIKKESVGFELTFFL